MTKQTNYVLTFSTFTQKNGMVIKEMTAQNGTRWPLATAKTILARYIAAGATDAKLTACK